ncbi:MAG: 16S rRNA (guanine(527)-N(7))-methyltransferase RsmG [Firmicutes bacterium]|nr:16S rRNA (guanine(527)-N(7))-methyltransferase RsmG [Bacillota bacterium]
MTRDEFINELKKLNIEVTEEKINLIDIYMNFLIEYNSHTNLTRIVEPCDIYLKHFYDSLTIVKSIDLNNYNNLLDIGSGAGFPGVVLKIFFPNLNVTLIDSNNKKTKFLTELSNKLNIKMEVINDRVEKFATNHLNSYDIVTSRAVANLRVLSEISLPLVKENGLFIALKGNLDDLFEGALDTIEIMKAKIIDCIKFELLYNAGTRNIVVIKKYGKTELTNLRTYDKIVKKPLKKNSK